MIRNRSIEVQALALALLCMAAARGSPADQPAATLAVAPATLSRIATVDPRYQSYNVEMAEVIGGKFWKPYDAGAIGAMKGAAAQGAPAKGSASVGVVGEDPAMFQQRPPLDPTNLRLRKLAAALGPAYMRTSGTWASTVYFDDAASAPSTGPPKGFQGVLTSSQWNGVIDFAKAIDARLVTSFAISGGVRDAAGVWTPDQAKLFLASTTSMGGAIAAAEFFNEPDMPTYGGAPPSYTAADYARDFAVFWRFAKKTAPDMRIVGPGSVGEAVLMPRMSGGLNVGAIKTADMLSATPRPMFDIFSYHFYGAASLRCASMGKGAQTIAGAALSEDWLSRTDTSFDFYVKGLRDRYVPGKAVWITETADAACGGNPWAATFLDSFRYLDQLGRLAQRGVQVIFHNTLASSEYGLLEQVTFTPRPNYWAALLWHRLMGTGVLDPGPLRPGLHVYAQCLPGHPGGVTLLAINNSHSRIASLDLPLPSQRYTLSEARLDDGHVRLNGRELALGGDDALCVARDAGSDRPDFAGTGDDHLPRDPGCGKPVVPMRTADRAQPYNRGEKAVAREDLTNIAASAGSARPSRRHFLGGLLTAYTASLIPWARAQPAQRADRGAFSALSVILVGRQALDGVQTARIYDALATDGHFPLDVQRLLTLISERHIDPRHLQNSLDAEQSPLAPLPRKILSAWYLGVIGSGDAARCIAYENALNAVAVAHVLKPPTYAYGAYGSWENKPI